MSLKSLYKQICLNCSESKKHGWPGVLLSRQDYETIGKYIDANPNDPDVKLLDSMKNDPKADISKLPEALKIYQAMSCAENFVIGQKAKAITNMTNRWNENIRKGRKEEYGDPDTDKLVRENYEFSDVENEMEPYTGFTLGLIEDNQNDPFFPYLLDLWINTPEVSYQTKYNCRFIKNAFTEMKKEHPETLDFDGVKNYFLSIDPPKKGVNVESGENIASLTEKAVKDITFRTASDYDVYVNALNDAKHKIFGITVKDSPEMEKVKKALEKVSIISKFDNVGIDAAKAIFGELKDAAENYLNTPGKAINDRYELVSRIKEMAVSDLSGMKHLVEDEEMIVQSNAYDVTDVLDFEKELQDGPDDVKMNDGFIEDLPEIEKTGDGNELFEDAEDFEEIVNSEPDNSMSSLTELENRYSTARANLIVKIDEARNSGVLIPGDDLRDMVAFKMIMNSIDTEKRAGDLRLNELLLSFCKSKNFINEYRDIISCDSVNAHAALISVNTANKLLADDSPLLNKLALSAKAAAISNLHSLSQGGKIKNRGYEKEIFIPKINDADLPPVKDAPKNEGPGEFVI